MEANNKNIVTDEEKKGRPTRFTETYNKEIKERFIKENNYLISTKERYGKFFRRIFEFENELGKDLYLFNVDEIKDMIMALSSTSAITVGSVVSIGRKYVQWAINEKYTTNLINQFELIDRESIKQMPSTIASMKKYFLNKDEYYNVLDYCQNPQDAICFILLYNGIKGEGFEDIINLKNSDFCKETKSIVVNGVYYYFDDKEVEIIEKASLQHEYLKMNGNSQARSSIRYLADTPYLLRGVVTIKSGDDQRIKPTMINKRIVEITKLIQGFNMTAMDVLYSGFFHKLMVIDEDRGVSREDYENVRRELGVSVTNWNDTRERFEEFRKNAEEYNKIKEKIKKDLEEEELAKKKAKEQGNK